MTDAELMASGFWSDTIAPAFMIAYEALLITEDRRLHRIQAGFNYVESNSFSVNAVPLPEGLMRYLSFEIPMRYTQYLPLAPSFDFLTGVSLDPSYRLSGRVIGPGVTKTEESFLIGLGPVYGISFSLENLLEIDLVSGLEAEIPVSGSVTYPDGSHSTFLPFGVNALLEIGAAGMFGPVRAKIEYRVMLEGNMLVNPSVTQIDSLYFTITQSIVISAGVVF
jgi:hypothetical protein